MYLWLSLPTDYSKGLCRCSAVQSIPCKMPGSYYSLDSLPELICVCSGDSLIPVQSHSDRQGRQAASFVRPHAKWKCKVPHLNIFKNVNMGTSTGPFWTWGPVGRQGSQAMKLALPARVNGRTGMLLWTVTNFLFLGFRVTVDGDCSHEIKRRLLLERKTMTNLDSILKSRDVTLLAKVHLVKVWFFQ